MRGCRRTRRTGGADTRTWAARAARPLRTEPRPPAACGGGGGTRRGIVSGRPRPPVLFHGLRPRRRPRSGARAHRPPTLSMQAAFEQRGPRPTSRPPAPPPRLVIGLRVAVPRGGQPRGATAAVGHGSGGGGGGCRARRRRRGTNPRRPAPTRTAAGTTVAGGVAARGWAGRDQRRRRVLPGNHGGGYRLDVWAAPVAGTGCPGGGGERARRGCPSHRGRWHRSRRCPTDPLSAPVGAVLRALGLLSLWAVTMKKEGAGGRTAVPFPTVHPSSLVVDWRWRLHMAVPLYGASRVRTTPPPASRHARSQQQRAARRGRRPAERPRHARPARRDTPVAPRALVQSRSQRPAAVHAEGAAVCGGGGGDGGSGDVVAMSNVPTQVHTGSGVRARASPTWIRSRAIPQRRRCSTVIGAQSSGGQPLLVERGRPRGDRSALWHAGTAESRLRGDGTAAAALKSKLEQRSHAVRRFHKCARRRWTR